MANLRPFEVTWPDFYEAEGELERLVALAHKQNQTVCEFLGNRLFILFSGETLRLQYRAEGQMPEGYMPHMGNGDKKEIIVLPSRLMGALTNYSQRNNITLRAMIRATLSE